MPDRLEGSIVSTKGEETRSMILDRALALVSQYGLEAISIGQLAKDVGMSKSGLFAHFDSKENLQLEVLRSAVDRFVRHVLAPALKEPRGEPRVRALFMGWLAWAEQAFQPGGCVFLGVASELDDRPGPLRDYLVSTQKDWISGMATAAQIAVREGHFRADLDVDQLAYEIYGITLSYHHFRRLLRDPDAARRAEASFETLLAAARS